MKFIHIADVHLGATPDSDKPWGSKRETEIWDSFRRMIEVCNEERVDLLLIAGDLFHRQPLVKELREVNYYFGKLKTAQVVIMAGNHDYIGVRSNYRDFAWNERVHMFLRDKVEVIEFDDIKTEVYGLSYLTRDITDPLYDTIKPNANDRIHILLAHGGDDRNVPMNYKKLQEAGFDYIAMGHIHKPEIIGSRMAYAGSLEPLDRNETGERGYILGEIVHGKINLRFIPSSIRQYKRLRITVNPETTNGQLRDLMKESIVQHGIQHIYTFQIEGYRDEHITFDTEGLKRSEDTFHILEIEDNSIPNYDFKRLYQENADNLIGMFIERLTQGRFQGEVSFDEAIKDEITRKALYYGIEALLGAKDR